MGLWLDIQQGKKTVQAKIVVEIHRAAGGVQPAVFSCLTAV